MRAPGKRNSIERVLRHSRRQPAHNCPWRRLESGDSTVFALKSVLHDLELQRTYRCQQWYPDRGAAQVEHLDHTLLKQLLQALAELFELRRIGIVQMGEC